MPTCCGDKVGVQRPSVMDGGFSLIQPQLPHKQLAVLAAAGQQAAVILLLVLVLLLPIGAGGGRRELQVCEGLGVPLEQRPHRRVAAQHADVALLQAVAEVGAADGILAVMVQRILCVDERHWRHLQGTAGQRKRQGQAGMAGGERAGSELAGAGTEITQQQQQAAAASTSSQPQPAATRPALRAPRAAAAPRAPPARPRHKCMWGPQGCGAPALPT